jgi:hypothetical protein
VSQDSIWTPHRMVCQTVPVLPDERTTPEQFEAFRRTPLLGVRGIGKIGYYSVAAELTETDLGPRCKAEWQRRLVVLRREWRIPSWPPNPRRREG